MQENEAAGAADIEEVGKVKDVEEKTSEPIMFRHVFLYLLYFLYFLYLPCFIFSTSAGRNRAVKWRRNGAW